ncbi:choline dehydrogenase [Actinacidiphila yanglinensis]|uniref:Choline dehydrogenase n=1 Tax=Actinacidiphila yanglinensis TaxID=310779 RepID=A0A1H6E396_9ACTN|nr:GMC family oxidoreductase N-terminal domain-containing protein [Actinacidiphila yanglinensis]SEG92027.1 choline dehydrogenase [Actinacidiphila yanglinensis]
MSRAQRAYDVVIVGGGTAGSVLAARLSQDEDVHVLLLEAGAATLPDEVRDPPAWPSLAATHASWGETTVVQRSRGTAVALPRGRGLGGSSAIDAMVFARGHRSGYDAWSHGGAKGWGFDDLLPYFQRSETALVRAPGRGTQGPLLVAPAAAPNDVLLACLDGAVEAGHPRARDISGGLEEGFAPVDLTIVDGRRQSAADAYLVPVLNRPNLHVVTEALAHRLLFDGSRCSGVEYGVDGRTERADCAGEVVLAAGAVGSAHLLLRSGVGPPSDLRQAGVDVVHALPGVGRNLHDHPRAHLVYHAQREVPAARYNHGEVMGLLRSTPEADGPDVQIVFADFAVPNPAGPVDNGFTMAITPIRPVSRGTVRLTSADPRTPPLVDPNYFAEEQDVRTALCGLTAARRIAWSSALAEWGIEEVSPGLGAVDEESIGAFARREFSACCQPMGTCAMGEEEMSVVDSELRVRGLDGLRVADASVIPSVPCGSPAATVYAVAERAADLLRP